MIRLEHVRIALAGIAHNTLRSILTMLGILIGVGSVIVLVAVGTGSAAAVQRTIEGLGTNLLQINRQFAFGAFGRATTGTLSRSSNLTASDVRALEDRSANPDIVAVAPVVNVPSVTAVFQGASYSPALFVGTTSAYQQIKDYRVAEGNFFTDADETQHNRVAVIGQTVATNLFGNTDPVGNVVRFNGVSYQVIGLLAVKGTNGAQDQDDIVIAPLSAVQDTLTGYGASYSSIVVEAASPSRQSAAQAEITATLEQTHHIAAGSPDDFRILNQASLLQTTQSSSRIFTTLLGAVAAISLLVGGIGVMNIMLVTVTERTREIGIRKAIGAKRSDIMAQFVVEAILLTAIGGLLGVFAGVVGSRFTILGIHPIIADYSIFLAFGVAVVTGLFFGLYPASRAARLLPVEALRYE
ncbi:MAG: ABC transporter permease [Acidothermus sp.]|nr:ABC transporter permease [Acidothermus sp.]MCL6537191.1 ABC transporter permease [Acidothermus sp.]